MSSELATTGRASAISAESTRWYAAMQAHDARFDGRFFVGVTSTGVYCRPVCRVRMPLQRHCRFFGHAAQAEAAGFRPCLRCRPELAPGLSLVDSPHALAQQAARLLDLAVAEGRPMRLPQVAARLGVTDRHLRRIFAERFGVSPVEYLGTRRLLQAKQLLTDTQLSVTDIAHATGFGSLRRFHAAFAAQYRLQPTALRRQRSGADADPAAAHALVRLPYRPPYDIAGLLRFFRNRAIPGLEQSTDRGFLRTLGIDAADGRRVVGWMQLTFDVTRPEVHLRLCPALLPHLGAVIARCRVALDLDADPDAIDPALAQLPHTLPAGLRLPGSFDGFETAARVILGQQVTVAAARTLALRLVTSLGEPLADAPAGLTHVFPTAAAVAAASPDTLGRLGIVRQRVGALQGLARAVAEGRITLHAAAPVEETLAALQALPGIGEWTAQLIAMRVLAWPDAFPASDIGVLNALGSRDIAAARLRAEAWRPWRSYAVIGLWQHLEKPHDHLPA